jgi:hypothetical protein
LIEYKFFRKIIFRKVYILVISKKIRLAIINCFFNQKMGGDMMAKNEDSFMEEQYFCYESNDEDKNEPSMDSLDDEEEE